jgi:membrane protein required for colicin V production
MTWVDYAVIVVLAASIGWGFWRGFVREVLSILAWVVGFLAANLFAGPLAEHMPQRIQSPELRVLAAFLLIFVLAFALTSLVGLIFAKFVRAMGLAELDRTLGALFGLGRGLLILLALAIAAGLTSLPRQPGWRDSASAARLAGAALALKPWLPPALADRLRYH